MLVTPIGDFRPAPGEVVVFDPTPAAVRAATLAPEHPVPPAALQTRHMRVIQRERAAGRTQESWLAVTMEIPGRLDRAAMTRALLAWVRRHPTLRCRFAERDGRYTRHLTPAATVDLTAADVPEARTAEQIRDHVHGRLAAGTDPLRWPAFTAGAIVRPASSTFYLGVDHCHADGQSLIGTVHELRRLYAAACHGGDPGLGDPGCYIERTAWEHDRSARTTLDSPPARRWADFWTSGPAPTFPLPLGVEPGRRYDSRSWIHDMLDGPEADSFGRVCRRQRAEFPAGLFAALGIAARELGGHPSYRGLTAMSTRADARWRSTLGWFVNLEPIAFPLAGARSFGDLLPAAQRALDTARELNDVAALDVLRLLDDRRRPGLGAELELPMVSFLDTRTVPGADELDAGRVGSLVGPNRTNDVWMWLHRERHRTWMLAKYPDTPVARRTVPLYLEHVRDVMRAVARTGDREIGNVPAAA
jgi:hypothetical protein